MALAARRWPTSEGEAPDVSKTYVGVPHGHGLSITTPPAATEIQSAPTEPRHSPRPSPRLRVNWGSHQYIHRLNRIDC